MVPSDSMTSTGIGDPRNLDDVIHGRQGVAANPDLCARLAVYIAANPGRRFAHDELAERFGMSKSMINNALRILREHGIVDWADGTIGTLHPTAEIVEMN